MAPKSRRCVLRGRCVNRVLVSRWGVSVKLEVLRAACGVRGIWAKFDASRGFCIRLKLKLRLVGQSGADYKALRAAGRICLAPQRR